MYTGSLSPQWSKRRQAIYPLKVLELQTISRGIDHSNVSLIETDSCLKEMNSFYGLLKVVNLYHVSRDFKTGKFVFSFWSLQTLYFIANYLLLAALVWFAFDRNLGFGKKNSGSFEEYVLVYQFYSFNAILAVPFLTFFESKKMSDYRNKWSMLQAKYTLFTGKIVCLKLRRNIIFVLFFNLLMPAMCVYYALAKIMPNFSYAYWEMALLCGYYTYILIIAGLAYGHWFIITCAIKQIAIIFTADIKGFENKETKMHLLDYKDIWVDFSRLIKSTGIAFCYTISLLLIFTFCLLTLASYSALSQFSEDNQDWISTAMTCFYTLTIFFFLSMIGISADNAVKAAGEDFQNALLELKSNSLMEENKKHLEQFLQVLSATPPVIDLGGFVVVNKSLNTSLMSTLVTYLIVLLQFKFSNNKSS